MSRKKQIFRTAFSVYKEVSVKGEGGSGRVYQVKNENDKFFALKTLKPEYLNGEKLKRFKNEIFFCLRNPSPNIIKVIDYGFIEDGCVPFYVMPLYEDTLRNKINNGIEHDQILPLFSKILDGIEAAHIKGIFHRDIKPENILTNDEELVICDFGIAHISEEELYTVVETKQKTRLANFQYAAPEQKNRGNKANEKSDIFALGLILNEMFTTEVPYGTGFKEVSVVVNDYAYLDEIIHQMISQDPIKRPNSIRTIKNMLRHRGNEFIVQQKLDKLGEMVISENELDDPLVNNPPKLVGIDWDKESLTLILSQFVNDKWVKALHNIGNYTFLDGKPPQAFRFRDNKASINCSSEQVQIVVNYFKSWLSDANKDYEAMLLREIRLAEEKERSRIAKEIENEKARQNVLQGVKI